MLSILAALLLSGRAQAWDQKPNLPIEQCLADLPHGVPVFGRGNTTLECHGGYALLHDNNAKIAIWAAWTLTPQESVGCVARTDAFVADAALPKGQRAEVADYNKSGFDKGHMVPDGDLSWDQQVEYESFLMSNMSPQYPNLNRGAWKNLEASTRAWAHQRGHSLTVYSGNIYPQGSTRTIGAGRVVVPERLYKIVVDDATGEVLAFIFPNVERQDLDLKAKLVSVAEVEAQTGVSFPLPKGADKTAAAKDVWPADLGDHAAAKKTTCKIKK
jgi:endonuclease G